MFKQLKNKLKKYEFLVNICHAILVKYYCFLTDISPTLNSKVLFKSAFGRKLDLKNPKTLNEKLMWLKLYNYDKNPLVYQCADKWAVRKYVEDCGCPELLNELLAVYDKPEQIDWDSLPQKFALKWSFGAGMNVICFNKDELDRDEAIKKLKKWGKLKIWRFYSEMQYKYSARKIVAEKFIESDTTDLPIDYKVFCFHGKPQFISEYIRDKDTFLVIRNYFDFDWNVMPFVDPTVVADPSLFPRPELLKEIYKYAEILSAPFPFVRADFYQNNGKVMFGELTFTPTACLCHNYGTRGDLELGQLLDLSKVEKIR